MFHTLEGAQSREQREGASQNLRNALQIVSNLIYELEVPGTQVVDIREQLQRVDERGRKALEDLEEVRDWAKEHPLLEVRLAAVTLD